MGNSTTNQNDYEFLTYEQIQSTISRFLLDHGYKISFKEAVEILRVKKATSTSLPEILDFSKWDINDNLSFKKIINKHSLDVKALFNKVFKETVFSDLEKMHEKNDLFFLQIFNDCPVFMKSHNFYEILYSLSGNCTVFVENEKFIIKENEFFLVAPYVSNCPEIEKDNILLSFLIRPSTFEKTFFNLLIQNNLLSEFFSKTLHGEKTRINHLLFSIENPTEIKTLLKLILTEYHKSTSYSNEICINLMSVVFSIILRDYENQIKSLEIDKTSISENSNFNLIFKYIEQNYSTVSLKKLSEIFHYEQKYIGKLIKKNTGMNFSELINNIRLKNARLLLKNKNFKISDVSEIVGFNSPDYFSSTFKKAYGFTPKKYMENI